ncbi:MAG: alpha,alpha-trehalase TreF [Cyclobacteriaceae bacterium]|nr:alpha,alpha-trehalase TreF [Cyclobacteriaceae bacterium]
MKKPIFVQFWGSLLLVVVLVAYNSCQRPAPTEEAIPFVSQNLKPEKDLQPLFHEVQMAGYFPDSKTFVDAKPLADPQFILEVYQARKEDGTLDLRTFLEEFFDVPSPEFSDNVTQSEAMIPHLHNLWSELTRQADATSNSGSLLPLPYPYVVPGGRFREVYYWDSYFTMLGLLKSNQDSLTISMIKNFAHLIDENGFIPNGNRTYYLGRSQPPFFSLMVMLWAQHLGDERQILNFLPQMKKEYAFWMEGQEELTADNPAMKRVVRLEDGTILNRYWDNYAEPRPESYKEDFELAEHYPESQREQVYRDLRAGAESGWDYSSRWFSDGATLDSIITTSIAPVDLNCLLYFMESSIASLSIVDGDSSTANGFQQKALKRASAIKQYFWDDHSGYFSDLNWKEEQTTMEFSAAGMMPLYVEIATGPQAQQSTLYLKNNLLFPGGVVSTNKETGQQWDYPNGWAPQQWIAIQGLRNYQQNELAQDISQRWLAITERVYNNTGKMMEKYNVVDLSLDAGGGEYPTQDGFGWTNGVTLALTPETP